MDVLDLWGMGRHFKGDNLISIIDARRDYSYAAIYDKEKCKFF